MMGGIYEIPRSKYLPYLIKNVVTNILLQVRSKEENNLQLDEEEVFKGFFFVSFVGYSNNRVDFVEGHAVS